MAYDIGAQFFAHRIGFELTAIPARYLHCTASLLYLFMFVDCAGQRLENGGPVGVFYLSCCFTRVAACASTGKIVQLRQRRAARACWRLFLSMPGRPLPRFTRGVTEFSSRGSRDRLSVHCGWLPESDKYLCSYIYLCIKHS